MQVFCRKNKNYFFIEKYLHGKEKNVIFVTY
jgi:hypothetical protein